MSQTTLKIIATFFNYAGLFCLFGIYIEEGYHLDTKSLVGLFSVAIILVSNLFAIYFLKNKTIEIKSWLALFFKRKALEEKKRIDNLSKNK